jgi:hypothetical protein
MIIIDKQNIRALTVEEQKTVIGTIITETEIKYYQQEDMEEYLEIMKQYEPNLQNTEE